jgi:hypothetical protein
MSPTITRAIPQTTVSELRLADPGDAQAALAVEAIRTTRQARQLATATRQQAQQEQVDKLRAAAAKLRHMATCSVASGVVQLATSMATATMSCINAGRELAVQQKVPDAHAPSPGLTGAEKLLDGFARADVPARISAHFEADKRALEIDAEQAGKRADDARERISECDRLEGSLRTQLERLHQARLACLSAAVRR